MDPNALLDELVELGYRLSESRNRKDAEALLSEIVHKATELREWISRGGFTPNTQTKGD